MQDVDVVVIGAGAAGVGAGQALRDEPIQRIVASGRRNDRIRLRRVDKRRFDEDAAIILAILNDAWGKNWGFVPITDAEISYIGKKLRPLVREDLINPPS